jgi:hypothetical protein
MASRDFNPPVSHVETKVIASYDVQVMELVLFKSVEVLITLKDASGMHCGNRQYRFEGEEYLAWNNDDEYIMTKIDEKLRADPAITPL